jgi:CBS domain-containing protein
MRAGGSAAIFSGGRTRPDTIHTGKEQQMRCEQIMERNVKCVSGETTVQDAARMMRDEDIGFLPVCDQGGKAIGALTDRDIAVRLVAEGKPASVRVSELVTREVISCKPGDDVREAQRLMKEQQKQRLMVVDTGGKLVGVISLQDLAEKENEGGLASTVKGVKEGTRPASH